MNELPDGAIGIYDQTLTLNLIRKHLPCEDGWRKLLSGLRKTKADDELLTISTIYRLNDFGDALWCLRALPDDRISRHFQAWCAERVLHIFETERPSDPRVRDQVAMLRNDTATPEERAAAQAAAQAAADAAQVAADAAADAAWAVAADAAADAADAAAVGTAADAAWAAAGATAGAAAGVAAEATAWSAAGVTAWAAAWAAQTRQFRKMIGLDQ